MSFWDDAKKKAAELTNKASDSAANLKERTKINSEISGTKKEIQELYLQLGHAYYDKYKDDPTAEQAGVVKCITDAENKIVELNAKLDQLKGNVACPSCGEKVATGASFCPKCGAKMPEIAAEEAPSEDAAE